jgi:serralysin
VAFHSLTGGPQPIIALISAAFSVCNFIAATDFSHLDDTFQLENAIFTRLGAGVHPLSALFFRAGAAALDANDYIVYNKATGALFYDVNGNGAGGAIQFATLTNHATLTAADFYVI